MRNLELVFKSDENKVKTIKLSYASSTLGEAVVKNAMDRIAKLEMFQKDGVNLYNTPVCARYVEIKKYPIYQAPVPATK